MIGPESLLGFLLKEQVAQLAVKCGLSTRGTKQQLLVRLVRVLEQTIRDRLPPARRALCIPQEVAQARARRVPRARGPRSLRPRSDTIWETHITREWSEFVREAWPFGPPYPRAYYDVRAEKPGGFRRNAGEEQSGYASLHAKCVVVDGQRAFISSANFTERAQERNIECGVLIDDPHFAALVGGQWIRLIEAGLVRRFDR